MTLLFAGVLLFFGVHSIAIVAPGWRARIRERIGVNAWKGVYSLLSLTGFVLLVVGYGQARTLPQLVYIPPGWTRHLALTLLLPVFPLLLSAYLPGRIKSFVRHPMLLATILWASAHLLTITTRADLLLFGSFLGWALADWVSALTRAPVPPALGVTRPYNDLLALVGGLGLYLLIAFWLHLKVIGLAPLG